MNRRLEFNHPAPAGAPLPGGEWGRRSRPFDMRCYRVMYAAGTAPEGNRTLEMALAGVCDLLEMDERDVLETPSDILTPMCDKVLYWFREAAASVKGNGTAGRMLKGDHITAMYASLLREKGILPDEIDRQDPAWFFAVITEEHLNEDDIDPGVRHLYGL